MPSITFSPSKLLPVRNPAWLELSCESYEQLAPQASVTELTFVTEPDAGQRIEITLPDGGITELVAVDTTPDDSGTQYLIGIISGATITNLVATANTNQRLLQYYTVAVVAGKAVFTSRTPGANSPRMVLESPAWGIALDSNAGSNGTYAPGYHVGVNLWVERVWGSGDYSRLPDMPCQRGADGLTRLDLATWLKPYTGYDWPALAASSPLRSLQLQRRYYWEVWEAYGDPVAPRAVERSSVRKAWFAGIAQADEHTRWSQLVEWLDGTNVNAGFLTPWLTYRGRDGHHEVSHAQQHYLGWYQRVVDPALTLRATVWYADGTSASTNALVSAVVLQGEIGQWPTGFETLLLDELEPTKQPYKYAVQLRTAGGIGVSELHTFWLVDADTNELHIEYLNSFGVVESLRTEGAWVVPAEAKHEAVSRQRRPSNGSYPRTFESSASSLLQGVRYNLEVVAGHCDTQAEHKARLDILYSPEWRLVDHKNGRKLPLHLLGSKQVSAQQGTGLDHLHQLELQFVLGDTEMAWSAMELLPKQPPLDPDQPE